MMESIFDSIVRNMREYPAQGYYVALPVPPHTKTVIPVLWPTPISVMCTTLCYTVMIKCSLNLLGQCIQM